MSPTLKLALPSSAQKLLLHTCCAPCSGSVIEGLLAAEIDLTIFFYNPNIHPREEYEIRKEENIRYAKEKNIPFVDADYDPQNWFARIKGLEDEPERGARCTQCFDMRLERSALYAYENKFSLFSSVLGVSRWKNMDQVNACGHRAAARYEGLAYWDYNWRKNGGSNRMVEIAKEESFYQQEYCGCIYSLRDQNEHREKMGRDLVKMGEKFYGTTV